MSYKFHPYERLPSNCPPANCINIEKGSNYYRLIKSITPMEDDFISHVLLNPDKNYSHNLCGFSSVSLFNNVDEITLVRKGPLHRNKKICKLKLNLNDGLIIETYKSHFNWYRDKLFTIEDLEYEVF